MIALVEYNQQIGNALIEGCQSAISNANLSYLIELVPCNWFVTFNFKDRQGEASMAMRTLAMQEMIKRGILFQGAFVPCFSHTLEDVNYFVIAFTETLIVLNEAFMNGVENLLIGQEIKPVFRKLI